MKIQMKILIVISMLVFTVTAAAPVLAEAYADDEIADAIFKAEGGEKAEFLYGIRSVSYKDEADARRICLNTIRDNRKRYTEYGHKEYPTFLEFLASRYAPTRGKGVGEYAKKVNKNWIHNVRFFLKKGRKR